VSDRLGTVQGGIVAQEPPRLAVDEGSPPGLEALDTGRLTRPPVAAVRIVVALMWIQNLNWKIPPDFGRARRADLWGFVNDAVEHPVVPAYSWVVEHLVLPNFVAFGWLTLLTEFGIGVFLLAGLLTRLWALVGIAQSLAITLSVLNTPGEWHWSYFLMIAVHVLLFSVAAGRAGGLDGVLRPSWHRSSGLLARLAVLAS
jgi:thiosulfate dehydrogenase (quinone) large subunit